MNYPKIRLHKEGTFKILRGELWLTLKDTKNGQALAESLPPGSLVSLLSEEGYFLAQAFFNPKVRYAFKVITREEVPIDRQFFFKALKRALTFRKMVYPKERAFRLVFAEGDFLCGLIIDIYGEVAVIQTLNQGMEKKLPEIISALQELLAPSTVLLKNDVQKRQEEGLPLYTQVAFGKIEDPLFLEMDGIKFLIPLLSGQKTGFFLDQREARRSIAKLACGKRVLDLFSYLGGFSFYALKGGAKEAILVDRSEEALNLAQEIARINNLAGRIICIKEDVLNFLQRPSYEGEILIADPPAFIKAKKDLSAGLKKYERLYQACLRPFVDREGLAFLFSCSHFLTKELLWEILKKVLARLNLSGRVFKEFNQPPDHPINPLVKETFYLKGIGLYFSY